MKSILVMGGNDFIGSALAEYLIKCGYKVDILTKGKKGVKLKTLGKHFLCDRDEISQLKKILNKKSYEYIYDMTAYSKDDIKNLIECIDLKSLKKYVVLSSGAVYKDSSKQAREDNEKGENKNWGKYGLDKKEAEDYIINSDIPYIIIRPTYIYGPNNNLYREIYFFERILQEKKIPVPHGKNVITQFIYIDDLVKVLESLTHNDRVREAYNVTNPQLISWNDLIQTCGEVVKKSPVVKLVDINKINLEERQYFPFRNIDYNLDIDKLIEHGLYIPNVLLKEGLKKTYKWYLSTKPKLQDKKMSKVDDIIKIS
ncbi:NAD-dependent epimerase/dehydratase family protein [Romboutsia lituseburensis]|uniref:NAD-dependent epimerase/dehydratase family protein n=1 Tax=Romboutsia lituseburensis TaxID=1537 RepID=UPI00215A5390|nr:NAD-dependent epimerase/dehydratase family protein [Romboutsia lituseburensis]MCR8745838.1 NAD-dependent epimerase/dehydratase family protein [Romboutsia lituseburensis]